ncbi:tRNA-specific adenosine deaminase 1 isoform X7 [Chrysemys picta bellii]|uniref:tRNA-specific adenosine deaminase 1 isoform X7 n=1 Tax=Chrysemys picta bellii TaxID=8478 RepID=UPI0032B14C78
MWSADEVAGLCYTHYSTKLPKQGKPDPNREWTLLAAVVKVESAPEREACLNVGNLQVTKEVVAMGTGTKCIGHTRMRKTGDILNDSHAEVIAKRSFQRYLVHQLWLAASHQQGSIFSPGTEIGKWKLKPHITFIFFCSHTPSISWSAVPEQPLDVTSNGFKQGTTKKGIGSHQTRSRICKVELFHVFQRLVASISQENLPESLREKKLETYWEYKEAAANYQEAWKVLRSQALGAWVKNTKDYLQFT